MIDKEKLMQESNEYDNYGYPEEFYKHHLNVLKNAKDINENALKAVTYLFYWKLGKIAGEFKESRNKLDFKDSEGHEYYSIGTTSSNYKAMKRSVERERLEAAINFRDKKISYGEFKPYANGITLSPFSIVLPAFYVHIWQPNNFPILDENVWKVFCNERGLKIYENTKPRTWKDYEKYTNFFNNLEKETGLDRRTIDRGLWVLGYKIKKKNFCTETKQTKLG